MLSFLTVFILLFILKFILILTAPLVNFIIVFVLMKKQLFHIYVSICVGLFGPHPPLSCGSRTDRLERLLMEAAATLCPLNAQVLWTWEEVLGSSNPGGVLLPRERHQQKEW